MNLSGACTSEEIQKVLGRVQISTSCVRGNLVAAGGFKGELAITNMEAGAAVAFRCAVLQYVGVVVGAQARPARQSDTLVAALRSTHVTYAENAITNGIEIFEAPSGAMRVMTSNNDMWLRIFDAETFLCCR